MTTLVDHDRELLAATARRHHDALPVRASTALSAAVDELIDPLTLPALVDIDAAETDDATAVIAAVQERMRAAGQDAPTVGAAMARTRAARELRTGLARARRDLTVSYAEDMARLARAGAELAAAGPAPAGCGATGGPDRPGHSSRGRCGTSPSPCRAAPPAGPDACRPAPDQKRALRHLGDTNPHSRLSRACLRLASVQLVEISGACRAGRRPVDISPERCV